MWIWGNGGGCYNSWRDAPLLTYRGGAEPTNNVLDVPIAETTRSSRVDGEVVIQRMNKGTDCTPRATTTYI